MNLLHVAFTIHHHWEYLWHEVYSQVWQTQAQSYASVPDICQVLCFHTVTAWYYQTKHDDMYSYIVRKTTTKSMPQSNTGNLRTSQPLGALEFHVSTAFPITTTINLCTTNTDVHCLCVAHIWTCGRGMETCAEGLRLWKSGVKFAFRRNKKSNVFGILSQLKKRSKSNDVHAQNKTFLSST